MAWHGMPWYGMAWYAGCTDEEHADARAGGHEGPPYHAVRTAVQRAPQESQGVLEQPASSASFVCSYLI